MQDSYPLNGDEVLLFKTSISFVDHLQEFLSAILTACSLVIPPTMELKTNLFSIIHYLQVHSIHFHPFPMLIRAVLYIQSWMPYFSINKTTIVARLHMHL